MPADPAQLLGTLEQGLPFPLRLGFSSSSDLGVCGFRP